MRFPAFVTAAILAAAALYGLFDAGYLRFNYPSAREFPLRGIDVSQPQGQIDWPAVERDGIAFAYIKATEGGDFTDATFQANWQGAGATGIVRGAYHFVTFCRPVADQLRHIIATVPAEKGTLPLVLDLEFGGNCAKKPAATVMNVDVAFLIQGIAAHYGRAPLFYMTKEFMDEYHSLAFPTAGIWIRDVFRRPSLPAGLSWEFWQFANRGRVAGIPEVVDLNVFRGNARDFQALLQ